ncbi:hypothetical protein, partial [Bacillus safensis]|uniref:hypothetical protein n=1 Tax=Bacillus safensis TaxID=561879 RepID=UPI003F7C463E
MILLKIMLLLSYLDWLYAFQGFCVYWLSYREKTDKMGIFFLSGSSYDRDKQNERIEHSKCLGWCPLFLLGDAPFPYQWRIWIRNKGVEECG